jgi:hypothetical protein
MPSSIISPFPVFNDLDGSPLENGYIYIGQSNLNPETAPVNVFWDAARTIPAAQPIRTIGGFPSRNGSPSNVYVEADTYSITVRNSRRVFVYSAFDQSDAPSSVFDISTQVITATAGQTTFSLTTFAYLPGTDTLQVYRNGLRLTSVTDYVESNTSTVTMTSPAALGDEFLFQGGAVITGGNIPGTGVSFIQAGTGAIPRNMQDKVRENVSVKDFGAVGDGAADDTAAIQAAVAASNNVVVPSGNYRITSTITVPANSSVHFQSGAYTSGSGSVSGGSIFKQSGSGASTRAQNSAIAGSVMGIEGIIEETEYPLKNEGGIWPGKTYAFQAISKTFDSSYNSTTPSPVTGLFVFVNNKNTNSDVVGILSDAVAKTSDDIVFGANVIARNDAGANNVKLVGLEIDIQPATGTTISSNSIGLALNIFTISSSAPAIQIGGVSGGLWNNGILVNGVSGSGIAAQTGAAMTNFINVTQGTFSDCAIRLSTGINNGAIFFGINFVDGSPRIFGDSSGNLNIQTGTSFGKIVTDGKVKMTGLPTSSSGLSSGDVWINGSVLNIVP